MAINYRSAVFFVKDIQASRRFYEHLLGQGVLMDHGPNIGYKAGFALWDVSHALEMIFGANKTAAGDKSELYFETDDLEETWERMQAANVEVVHALREQPWGQRVFRVRDPDGRIIELGEPMWVVVKRFLARGMTLKEIAARTAMPLEVIKHIESA